MRKKFFIGIGAIVLLALVFTPAITQRLVLLRDFHPSVLLAFRDTVRTAVGDSVAALSIDGFSLFINADNQIAQKVYADTTALKAASGDSLGSFVNLKQLSSSNTTGGGMFVYADSGTGDTKFGLGIRFKTGTATKHWVRSDYKEGEFVNLAWTGINRQVPSDISEQMQALIDAGYNKILIPGGTYYAYNTIFLDGTAGNVDNTTIIGEGGSMFNTQIFLPADSAKPVFDMSNTGKKVQIENLSVGMLTKIGGTPQDYALVDLSKAYLSVIRDLWVYKSTGDGIRIKTGAGANRIYSVYSWFNDGSGVNIGAGDQDFFGCSFEYNDYAGIYIEPQEYPNYPVYSVSFYGGRVEGNPVIIKGAKNITFRDVNFVSSSIFGNEISQSTFVDNDFISGGVYLDPSSHNNIINNRQGEYSPYWRPVDNFYSSIISDFDFVDDGTAFWSGSGTGSVSKNMDGIGSAGDSRISKGALKITSTSGEYKAIQNVQVNNGETYHIGYVFWGDDTLTTRFEITSPSDSTIIDTVLTSWSLSGNNRIEERKFATNWYNETNLDSVKIKISAAEVGSIIATRLSMVKNLAQNGGFTKFSAGIPVGWTNSGSATVSQSTTTYKSDSSSVKMVIANGQNGYLNHSITDIDNSSLYLFGGFVFVEGGNPAYPSITLGNATVTTNEFKFSAPDSGGWYGFTKVVHPFSSVIGLGSITNSTGKTITAYWDDIFLIKLKGSEGTEYKESTNFDLSGSATTDFLFVPQDFLKITKMSIVYTQSTSSDAGISIQIGKNSDANYYASFTTGVSKSIYTVENITLFHTDLRPEEPVTITMAGGKTGAGECKIIMEYE